MQEPTHQLVAQSSDIHGEDNFLQGCSFSPDGLCVLTNSVSDCLLRLYNTPLENYKIRDNEQDDCESSTRPNWTSALVCKSGDAVRSYTWFPPMKSSDPATCCFLAAARDQPLHLYDAYSGAVRASYRPYNALDELESPSVVQFDCKNGQRILASGFRTDRTIHVFDTAVPGRQSTIWRLGKTRRSSDGQKGLVSALSSCSCNNSNIFAVGTYAPGSIYLYDYRMGEVPSGTILDGLCVVGHGKGNARKKRRLVVGDVSQTGNEGEEQNWLSAAKVKWFHVRAQGGVTQLMLPSDNFVLYSASRRSNAILSWDLRMLSGNPDHRSNPIRGLSSYETRNETNQRLEFDVGGDDDNTLYVGGQDNCIRMYALDSGTLLRKIEGLNDSANGVSFASVRGRSLLAVATGARHFTSDDDDNWSSDSDRQRFIVSDDFSLGGLSLYEFAVYDSK